MGYVLRLIVGRVEVVHTTLQAGLHDGEVLVGQGKVHHELGLEIADEGHELLHAVGIYLCGAYGRVANGFNDSVALALGAAGNHDFGKNVGILCHLVCGYGGHATSTDDEYFSHGSILRGCVCLG